MMPRLLPWPVWRWLLMVLWLIASPAGADVLIATNGERFVGRVINETADSVVFESELGGRLTISRKKVLEIQRAAAIENKPAPITPATPTTTAAPTNSTSGAWVPLWLGQDDSDWVQLKSGEWLKGRLKYIQEKKVQFDSDELKDLSLNLKDVRQVYVAKPMFTKFEGRDRLFGKVILSNDVVQVLGPEQTSLPRELLTGVTPGGEREIDLWSGRASISLNFQSGNTHQVTLSTTAQLARRTPSTVIELIYLGNFSEVNGIRNANNHRLNGSYDIRLNREWFLRPIQFEYYHDPLANIDTRLTGGISLGYYIFDRPGLEWLVSGGPGYQYTRFETVETAQDKTTDNPAAVVQSSFKADFTQRLKFIQSYNATVTSQDSGLYTHHAVSTLEFEIKRHLNVDVSFVWDYLQNPQIESSGTVPQHSDFRLLLGLGVSF